MKYLKLFLIGVATLGMASCQQDVGSLGTEQRNPQEDIFNPSDLQLALDEQLSNINLNTLNAQNPSAMVPAVSVVAGEDLLPEGTQLQYTMQFAPAADFANCTAVALQGTQISVQELNDAFVSAFNAYDFNQETLNVRVAVEAFIPSGDGSTSTNVRIGGDNYYYLGGSTINVTPIKKANIAFLANGANTLNQGNQLQGNGNADNLELAGFIYISAPYTLTDMAGGLTLGYADGNLSTSSTTAIPVPEDGAGLYYIHIYKNDAGYGYDATHITAAGAIGGFNDWGGDVALTPSDNDLVWTGNVDFGAEGSEFKVRFNGGWDISVGNDLNPLNPFPGSSNIAGPAGTYKLTMSFKQLPYTITLAKN